MKAHEFNRRTVLLPFACALVLPGCREAEPASPEMAAVLAPASPLMLDYVKVESAPNSLNWFGGVTGDIDGGLETRVVGAEPSGHILHIRTEWSVDAGAQSFEAELAGTLDTKTGRLLLNGEVTSGYLAGAQAHNQGRLTGTDPTTGGTVFTGFLRIVPGSAN